MTQNLHEILIFLFSQIIQPKDTGNILMTMKIDQKARFVFWEYGWVSLDQIAHQLGQHQSTIDSLLSKARSLTNKNMHNQKWLWEAKRYS
jgi:hypothetical protein